jgi:hypothetical protein
MTDRFCIRCHHTFLQTLATAMTDNPSYGVTERLLETNHTPIAAAILQRDLLNF